MLAPRSGHARRRWEGRRESQRAAPRAAAAVRNPRVPAAATEAARTPTRGRFEPTWRTPWNWRGSPPGTKRRAMLSSTTPRASGRARWRRRSRRCASASSRTPARTRSRGWRFTRSRSSDPARRESSSPHRARAPPDPRSSPATHTATRRRPRRWMRPGGPSARPPSTPSTTATATPTARTPQAASATRSSRDVSWDPRSAVVASRRAISTSSRRPWTRSSARPCGSSRRETMTHPTPMGCAPRSAAGSTR